jgi:glutamyl/glutaminyl-tRNA synthetase
MGRLDSPEQERPRAGQAPGGIRAAQAVTEAASLGVYPPQSRAVPHPPTSVERILPPDSVPHSPRELLHALRQRLSGPPLTRFAPAPTGHLHLGHLVSAIWVWGIARALGGRVLLRIEDHDRNRSRAEFEAALLEDLEWLGLEPDIGTLAQLRHGPSPHRQSNREGRYAVELQRLVQQGFAYGCRCTRGTIAAVAGDAPDRETPYPGTCRGLGLEPGPGLGARIVMQPGMEVFDDVRLGRQAQDPWRQCGDLLARDRSGNRTYQFCVAVDDRDQGVDLVIRGEDLLDSTGRQLRLARMLGRHQPPVFLHHPLIRRPDGTKLSKANRDTGVRELREAGLSAAMLLGDAACRSGLIERPRPVRAAELAALFAV